MSILLCLNLDFIELNSKTYTYTHTIQIRPFNFKSDCILSKRKHIANNVAKHFQISHNNELKFEILNPQKQAILTT